MPTADKGHILLTLLDNGDPNAPIQIDITFGGFVSEAQVPLILKDALHALPRRDRFNREQRRMNKSS